MFSKRFPKLTPEVCRAAQQLCMSGHYSCMALAHAASGGERPLGPGPFPFDGAFEQATDLLRSQEEFRSVPLNGLGRARQVTARVMYLELLALAQEDGLL